MEPSTLICAAHRECRPPPEARQAPRPALRVDRAAILVIDDDPDIAALLTHSLVEEGYAVRSAPDGESALEAIDQAPPDLIVSDVMMPGLDGVSLAHVLRRAGYTIPVILISAVYQDVDIPGVRFVPKPFDLDYLLEVIAHALAQHLSA